MGGVRSPPAAQITVGPGLFYAQELFRQTGVPQGIIPCAHGGTTMAQWDPKLKSRGRRSLYGALCRRLAKNGGRVAGLLWYQGCSDANTSTAPLYTKRMEALIRSVRRDTSDPRLPIAVVQISRVVNWDPNQTAAWNSIQDQQRRLPHRVPRCTVVPAIDLTLGDSIHLDAAGQERLGRRLVYAVRALLEGSIAGLPPLDVGRIEVVPNRVNGMADVVVHVNHVVGRLAAPGRPNGFELAGQAAAAGVHRIDLDGSRAILRTTSSRLAVEGSVLYYGRGFHPYCNIGDEAGRSLPVMGPLYVGEPRALTPFAQRLRVSRFLPSAGTLNGLVRPPADLGALGLRSREFPGQFADLHGDYAAGDATDQLVYFACAIECARRMRLSVNLGYDGPVRMWVNGRSVFHDPKGTNPAWPDMATVPFSAAPGRHEVLVALATNRNRAWGIFLRFGRLDLTRRQIEAQPPAYAMPSVLG
jgi:hypothetical protein